jgi:hypothetical protein
MKYELLGKSAIPFVLIVSAMWFIQMTENHNYFNPYSMAGVTTVWAASHYGISGKSAPELELDTWIDGNGKTMEPIILKEFHGKVVYLYFFQDW